MKEGPAVTVGPNGEVEVNVEDIGKRNVAMPSLPKPLTLEEKKYLLAVERGDMANVRRILQRAHRKKHVNINCLDPLGRGALSIAIDAENLEMVELLVVLGVETKDSLLQAINVGFVEAVELLLEHEELIHREGEPYSWEKVDWNTAQFTPDITPLILAAHRNNYEILKILLDRGATLPMPHEIKCGCDQCIKESEEDSLRFSMSRINEYKALASPSLIALSSSDPILTAFELSWDLRNLAFAEQESKADYMELRRQCQQLAVSLLDQTRSSTELAIILNHDPESPPYEEGEHMKLARLELAITYKQKKFVAHPNIQQLLASIWYEGLPGFRRKSLVKKLLNLSMIALLFPFYCLLYIVAPNTATGKLMRKPFMKFLIHASSYLFFLLLLILVSQRAELVAVEVMVSIFGSDEQKRQFEQQQAIQRGKGPMILECVVGFYILGFIWEETMEIWIEGINKYLRNMWNFIDFTRNALYVAVFVLRCAAYIQQSQQISADPRTAYIPREEWDAFDPQLIAEGLFAAANVFSALKLVHMFSINPHLGPLQISLGRMVIDIVKFFFIYSLVLFAFACGLNQLLWYFAELERRKCYSLPGGLPDWDNKGDSCTKWRSFGNLFESSQSLFWASFGNVGIDSFELTGIKTYTRFWGLLMFGSYSVINVIVLLNLLIAMMSNSYAMIDEHSDTEWKFARTKLWMSYFEESATLPPPFNIFPTPKLLLKFMGVREKDKMRRMSTKRKERKEKERDYRYTAVMRSLVWRYTSAMQRQADDNPVTEDDVNEIKGEITTMRYELLDVLESNGLDVSSAAKKDKTAALGKKMKVWERRLMKDFHLAPVAAEEEMDSLLLEPPPDEDMLSKFRRIAKLAVLSSAQQKWGQVIRSACKASQIGHCNSREAFKSQQTLQRAMAEAQKLVTRSPKAQSRAPSPSMSLPDTTTSTIMELLKDFETEEDTSKSPKLQPGGSGSNAFLTLKKGLTPHASPRISKSTTPTTLSIPKDTGHSGSAGKSEDNIIGRTERRSRAATPEKTVDVPSVAVRPPISQSPPSPSPVSSPPPAAISPRSSVSFSPDILPSTTTKPDQQSSSKVEMPVQPIETVEEKHILIDIPSTSTVIPSDIPPEQKPPSPPTAIETKEIPPKSPLKTSPASASTLPKSPVKPSPASVSTLPKSPVKPSPTSVSTLPKSPVKPSPTSAAILPKSPVKPSPASVSTLPKSPVKPSPASAATLPKSPVKPSPVSIPEDSTNSTNVYSLSSSSQEPLIPPESPEPIRGFTSEFKPIKRQQKEGWL